MTQTDQHLEWDDIPSNVLREMEWLGSFSPTVNAENREVKGYMIDSDGDGTKVYLSSDDLRHTAAACIYVADWLDARAVKKTNEGQP